MRRTRNLKLAIALFFLSAVPAALAYSAGPPAARTGAPGELTCRECHTGAALNQSPGELAIEGVPATYEPGESYTVTIRITHPDRRRWGFQVAAFTDVLENGGTLSVIDSARTRKVTAGARDYIEHVTAGTYAGQANGASWTVRWTAPESSAGTVTFYAAGNASNNNGTTTGDNIYTAFAESRPPEAVVTFENVTAASGLDPSAGGDGFAWADYDADGDFDLFVARTARGLLYRNDGGRFTEMGAQSGLSAATGATSAAWGDTDNDGRPDLALATGTGVRLFTNDPSGFADATSAAGLSTGAAARAVSWADFDGDGDLDLFASFADGTRLFRNSGTGAFAEATDLGLDVIGAADAIAWADYDGDGRLDVFVATATRGMLFTGETDGGLELVASTAVAAAANGRAGTWADYDEDGDLDLFVAGDAALRLLRNDRGVLVDATATAGLSGVSGRSIAAGDSDGDGRLDLLVTGAGTDRLMRFDGSVFVEVANKAGLAEIDGRAAAWADYDGDGRVDAVELSSSGIGLWKSPSTAAVVSVRAVTDADNDATDGDTATDRDALGATVVFDVDGVFESGPKQARAIDAGGSSAQAPPRAYFAAASGATAGVRSVFADGEGRQAAVTVSAGGSLALRDARAATITGVTHRIKNGKDKLIVDGERFRTGSEVLEVDGARLDTTKYPAKKQLSNGTTARVVGSDSAFGTLVPAGRPVLVTTYDPATGIRSAPFAFER